MTLDPTKVQYSSLDIVDKIPVYSTKTDGQGLGINGSLAVGAASALPSSSIFVGTVANPYGRKCLVTMSWSLDGTNYYPMNTPTFYFNATFSSYFFQALGFAGCSNSLIYIACTTQYTSAQTMYFQIALDSPT